VTSLFQPSGNRIPSGNRDEELVSMGISHGEGFLPATPGLQKGDLVRVTRVNRMTRYKPGAQGMIVMGPNGLGGELFYDLVMMSQDDPPCIVIFAEDEIEPDY
jgi:hypothetical protein